MVRFNIFILYLFSCGSLFVGSSHALDIGGAIKNLVKSPELSNDDASGTIVSTVVDSEKKANTPNAVTCDDLLAQAVVRANEQKLAALSERDAALLSAANATIVSNECTKKLSECQQEMMESDEKSRVYGEQYQQVQIDSEQKIQLIQLQTERLINSTVEKSQLDIQSIQNQTTARIEEITKECQQQLERVQHQADDEVLRTNQDAEKSIAKIQQEYDAFVSNFTEASTKEKQRVEQESTEAIHEVQLQMERLKIETENQLSLCKVQSKEKEDQVRQETDDFKVKLEQRAKKIQSILRAQRTRTQVYAEQTLAHQRKEAEEQIAAIQKTTEEKIQRISSDMGSQLSFLQGQLDDEKATVSQLTKTKDSLQEDLVTAYQTIKENGQVFNQTSNQMELLQTQLTETMALNSKLSSQVRSLETLLEEKDAIIHVWDSKPKTYVNVTLLKEDFKSGLHYLFAWGRKSMSQAYHILQTETKRLKTNAPEMASRLRSSMKYYLQTVARITTAHGHNWVDKSVQWFTRFKESTNLGFLNETIATPIKRQLLEFKTKFVEKVKPLLVESMARIEAKVKPSLINAIKYYEAKVAPSVDSTYHQLLEFSHKNILPTIKECKKTLLNYGKIARKTYRRGRAICIQKLIKGTNLTIQRVMSLDHVKDNAKLRLITLNSLNDVRDNAPFYVDAITAIFALLIILRCRYLIFWLVKTLFRIVWFFFPLRFIFTTRKSSRNTSIEQKAYVNGHSRHSQR